jgi:hypothetical protein
MLDAEDHSQRHGSRRCRKREKPCLCWRCLRDCADLFHCGARCKPAGLDILDGSHRRNHAIHVHTHRIGSCLGDQSAVLIAGHKLQFPPARRDLGAQP